MNYIFLGYEVGHGCLETGTGRSRIGTGTGRWRQGIGCGITKFAVLLVPDLQSMIGAVGVVLNVEESTRHLCGFVWL